MKSWGRLAGIGLAAALLPAAMWRVYVMACGPDFEPEVFVTENHPDKPDRYVEGELGIVRNTYYHADLVVAYRYLSGGRLSDAEKAAYAPAMQDSDEPYGWDQRRQKQAEAAVSAWLTVRNGVPGAGNTPAVSENKTVERKLANYTESDTELNCADSAFLTASRTLDARAKTWGAESEELKEWVRGQNAVFANCIGAQPMPDAARPEWKMLLREDRAYQIAAAEFYAGKYDDAVRDFEAIGKDASSPWSRWGEYLAARAEVRRAAFDGKNAEIGDRATFDLDGLRAAQTRLLRIEKESRDPEIQHAAMEEMHFIEVRLEPAKRLDEAAAALMAPDGDFAKDLGDLDFLIDTTPSQADLARWIQQMQSKGPIVQKEKVSAQQMVDEWKQRQTMPWMVAAISRTPWGSSDELLAEAAKVRPDAPGYGTVNYYRAQWMLGKGQLTEARTLLTGMLARLGPEASESERNSLLGARMPAARNLAEFLGDAPRTVISGESANAEMAMCGDAQNSAQAGCTGKLPAKEFDVDGASYLNTQMPLAVLEDAAENPALPANLRQAVASAAWVRAVGLEDEAAAKRMAKLLPAKVQKTAGESIGYPATLAMLRAPGLRPFLDQGVPRSVSFDDMDHYRDNWWCGRWTDGSGQGSEGEPDTSQMKLPALEFLTVEQRKQAETEGARLNALPQGLVWVGQRVIAHVKAHPEDKDNAEILAVVVQGTRRGCEYDSKGKPQNAVSKEAFELLHRLYPRSEWAIKTKYYY